jgi:hypothetical protein
MRHPSIQELFAYWELQRGCRAAPDRADIEPGTIRKLLADTFILSFDAAAGHPFRIAGTRLCAAFGRELKGERFFDLWDAASRPKAADLMGVVGHEAVGVLASVRAVSTSSSMHDLELLALPLMHRGSSSARVLGALAARDATSWLGTCTLGPLTLGTLRYLGPGHPPVVAASPPTAPARPTGRIRHGFVVYDGGQS